MAMTERLLRRAMLAALLFAAFGVGGGGGFAVFMRYVGAPAIKAPAPMGDAAFIAMAWDAVRPLTDDRQERFGVRPGADR